MIGSLFAYAIHAQEATKGIAFVDADIIYKELPSYKALQERVDLLKQEAESQIKAITEKVQPILEGYQENQQRLENIDMSEADRKALNEKQQQLMPQLQRIQAYIQQEQYRLQSSIQALLLHQVSKDKQDLKIQLTNLAQENGYEFLLDKSLQTDNQLPLVNYYSDRLDHTEFFLSLLLEQ